MWITTGSAIAMVYLVSLFRAAAFITLIIIAKDSAWRSTTAAGNTFPQQNAYDYEQGDAVYGGLRA